MKGMLTMFLLIAGIGFTPETEDQSGLLRSSGECGFCIFGECATLHDGMWCWENIEEGWCIDMGNTSCNETLLLADGSQYAAPKLVRAIQAQQEETPAVARNCVGRVVDRQYSPAAARALRDRTFRIQI